MIGLHVRHTAIWAYDVCVRRTHNTVLRTKRNLIFSENVFYWVLIQRRECVAVKMPKYLLLSVLVATLSLVVDTKTSMSPAELTRDADSCTLPLPIGCSCVQDRTAISVECSGAQMTSVPKHWFGSGNLVVKTLNLERNNISEVSSSYCDCRKHVDISSLTRLWQTVGY